MNDQLILKFPSQQAYKKEDFYVSPSNQEAYDFINSWPKVDKTNYQHFWTFWLWKVTFSIYFKKQDIICLYIEFKRIK